MRSPAAMLLILLFAFTGAYAWMTSGDEDGRPDGDDLAAWAARMEDPDPDVRVEAAGHLSQQGPAAIPYLEAHLLRHVGKPAEERPPPQGRVDPRTLAAAALSSIGRPALPLLLEAMAGPEHHERDLAARALRSIGLTTEDLPALMAYVDHENEIVFGIAASLLRTLGDAAREAAWKALDDVATGGAGDKTRVRRRVGLALALAPSDDEGVAATVDRLLDHPAPGTGAAVLHHALVDAPAAASIAPERLLALWKSGDDRQRSLAATHLSNRGPEAMDAVRLALADADPLVRRLGLVLLVPSWDVDATTVALVRTVGGDPDPAVRTAAVAALARLGQATDADVEALLEATAHEDVGIRRDAARGLGEIVPPRDAVTARLTALVGAEDALEARIAIAALRRAGARGEALQQALEEAVGREDERVAAAQDALETLRAHTAADDER